MKKIFFTTSFFALFLFVIFYILDYLYPLDYAKLYRPQSQQVRTDKNEVLRFALSKDGFWRFDLKEHETPPLLKKSVLLFEDRYFYYHFGINPFAILRSALHNIGHDNTIGASTISMQVARMLHRRERSYQNKLIEMFNALQLEWHFSKDEILNFYLNLAPYGGNIEGVKAASYFYFKKNPNQLNIAQIALLTTIPKNPNINRPDRQKNLKNKRKQVLQRLYKNNLINKSAYLRANIEPISRKRYKAPFLAPHYTNLAFQNKTETVHIDLQIQNLIRITLQHSIQELASKNVKNAAAILIDNKTMQIKAYVGSHNFFGKLGQNDGILAIRSPGSTLKPFVYANALDEGLITPKKELFDVPFHMGFWNPENYSRMYAGTVRADEALQNSLNIPAITLNFSLKNSLYETLKKAKITSVNEDKSYYGNGIVLGGFGISLMDLTHLYTVFSNKGVLLPLEGKNDQNISLLSKESAWLVSEMLSEGNRPNMTAFWDSGEDIPKIGFKTGTSANAKDLYTIGYSKEYTLGIWMGNFDGQKTQDLAGIQTAAHAVFKIFHFLHNKQTLHWLDKPKKIKQVLLCEDAIKKGKCDKLEYDYIIKGIHLKESCKNLTGEIFNYLLQEKKITSIKDLQQSPCYFEWKNLPPIIASPYNEAVFLRDQKINKLDKIMLKCYSFAQEQQVYFKIDKGELIPIQSGKEFFVNMSKGHHTIRCVDSNSKMATHTIEIKEE